MQRGAFLSAVLHLAVILVMIFGIPFLSPPESVEEPPIVVDILPISEVTNVKVAQKTPAPQPPKPEPPKPEPPKPAPPPPPPPPTPTPPTPPPPTPVPPKPDPAPLPKPAEKPAPPKPLPPKPQVKPRPPQQTRKNAPDDFDQVLRTVENLKAQDRKDDKADKDEATSETASNRGPSLADQPLSMTEMDAIRQQLEACWSPPVGARDAKNLVVAIKVEMNSDGTVQRAEYTAGTSARSTIDAFYRAAAESAMRTLYNPQCVPLKLPPDKYATWKSFTVTFDPKDML